jgi:tripartite-type tricarboxylate transporter receptor subunit TctC
VKFPKGADPAMVEALSALCKEVCESPEFAETLKTYYAQPYYRDAATMNVEDPQEVEELKANLQ